MTSYDIPEYNLTLIDFNNIFFNDTQIDILDDLSRYGLVGCSINNKDVKKLVYHHLVLSLCNAIVYPHKCKPIIVIDIDAIGQSCCTLMGCITGDFVTFLKRFVSQVKQMLPVHVVFSNMSPEHVLYLFNKSDARAHMFINGIIVSQHSLTNTQFTFEKMKQFTKKYELTFLNTDYFNQIKTRHHLIK